jgi:hypothetical protein
MRAHLVALLCCIAAPAFADDGLRCGNRLISAGATAAEVLGKCGEPTTRDRRPVYSRRGAVIGVIDIWTYDFGPHDFIRILRLANGILERVDLGDYGAPR